MPDASAQLVTILECGGCGSRDAGPRTLCPSCHAAAMAPVEVPGDGSLVTWTLIRRPPASFREDGQYAVALVKLDAGVQVTGRLAEPSECVVPGARVKAVARHRQTIVFALA